MGREVVVVAPHPDDETLGCGGTLLRHAASGDRIHWIIVTQMDKANSTEIDRERRKQEIEAVSRMYGFTSVHRLGYTAARLESYPLGDIVASMGEVFRKVLPEIVYLPYPGDIHSDHQTVFQAASACTKWFRYPTVKKIMCYETLSETDFDIHPDGNLFRPNVFVDITDYLDEKIKIMTHYSSEMGDFPFPRSIEAIQSLSAVRGAAAGAKAAEGFMLLKEMI
ncbi:GlcNAc-PI de-N-acetylase [Xylanibacillus composti]|uniref:GlcNAc-PI de-N-acetylase n=1 Tax=Xylanibacillus composti TaxID=1572762 RepID=A0A8J4H5D7_9BACL|nr:PIG-L deacetylase family protein [Xylanibacillus composti]GIQ69985.1 GlcNAc-PI de-N-acetylase [Xylanibacillus composti]